jgi:phosphoglycerate dehydrogenase-like enzyme
MMEKTIVLVAYELLRPFLAPAAERFPHAEFRYCGSSKPAVLKALRSDTVVMTGLDFPPPSAAVQNLRWFHLLSAGYDFLLGRPLPNPNVMVTNSSRSYSGGMAEFVLMRMLMHAKRAYEIMETQQKREWNRIALEGRRLKGRSLLVIGNGAVGREVGRLAKAFGMRIQILGPAQRHELPEAVGEAEYIVIAASLNPTTRRLVNKDLLLRMKARPYLINVSRGAIIDTDDLIEAVRARILAGAALDVFEQEPLPPNSPLYQVRGIALSPHISGVFEELNVQLADVFCDNLGRFLSGRALRNQINSSLRRFQETGTRAQPRLWRKSVG